MNVLKIFKYCSVLIMIVISMQSKAQEVKNNEATFFNRWSIEANIGQNKPVRPFSVGYYSSDPSKYFNFSEVNHFVIGVRYMFSNVFGFKIDYARDQFNEQSGSGSLPFDTQSDRFGFQGVMNLGRLLQFQSFTNRIGLLAHGGVQVSQFTVNQGVNNNLSEDNGGIMFGITPQVRLAKWLALTADFTIVNNIRQHLNWDGSLAASDNNLAGLQYNTSLGLTFYLGKKAHHADWYVTPSKEDSTTADLKNEFALLQEKITSLQNDLKDSDQDGVPDRFDTEPNTKPGSVVNTKGATVQLNPVRISENVQSNEVNAQNEIIKRLKDENRLVLFFNFNNDNLIQQSKLDFEQILEAMIKFPDLKADLVGYTDPRGTDKSNKILSLKRAQKVKQLLMDAAVEETRINVSGAGVYMNSEMTKNSNSFGKARRVEVNLVTPKKFKITFP